MLVTRDYVEKVTRIVILPSAQAVWAVFKEDQRMKSAIIHALSPDGLELVGDADDLARDEGFRHRDWAAIWVVTGNPAVLEFTFGRLRIFGPRGELVEEHLVDSAEIDVNGVSVIPSLVPIPDRPDEVN